MYVLICIQKLNSIQLHVRKSQQKLAILVCVRIGVYRDGGSISNLVETYIKNTYLTFISMLLYCAFGGHLKTLHLLAFLGRIWLYFLPNLMVGTPPPLSPPFRHPWVYVASYVQWCDVDSGPLWITQWGKCTKIFSFNLYENYNL